jgi:hypothetical protein
MNNRRIRFAPALCALALTMIAGTGCQGDQPSTGSSSNSKPFDMLSYFPSFIVQPLKPLSASTQNQNSNSNSNGNTSFLGLASESWIDSGLLGIGLTGIYLAVLARNSGHRHRHLLERNQKETAQLKKQVTSLELAKSEASSQLLCLSQKIALAEEKIDNLAKRVNTPPSTPYASSQVSSQSYGGSSLLTKDLTSQLSPLGPSALDHSIAPAYHPHGSPLVPSSSISASDQPLKIQSSAERQAQITAAFNNGDRQVIRAESSAQLNITNASDNAIAMGRLFQTELEEVSAGGSYYLVRAGSDFLLYPSEQTLKGFGEIQPSKGVFEYIKQAINAPQILSPALMDKSGVNWRIQQMGRIAVPS